METFNEIHPYIHISIIIFSFVLMIIGILNFMLNVKLNNMPKIKTSALWETVEKEFTDLKESLNVLKLMERFVFFLTILVISLLLWKLKGFQIHFLDGNTPLIYLVIGLGLNIFNFIYTIRIIKSISNKYKAIEYYYKQNFTYFTKEFRIEKYKKDYEIILSYLDGKEKILFESFKNEILETSKYYNIEENDIKWILDFSKSIQNNQHDTTFYNNLIKLDNKYH